MSKGTKQIRLGRVLRLLAGFEERLEILRGLQKDGTPLEERIEELEKIISTIKREFEL